MKPIWDLQTKMLRTSPNYDFITYFVVVIGNLYFHWNNKNINNSYSLKKILYFGQTQNKSDLILPASDGINGFEHLNILPNFEYNTVVRQGGIKDLLLKVCFISPLVILCHFMLKLFLFLPRKSPIQYVFKVWKRQFFHLKRDFDLFTLISTPSFVAFKIFQKQLWSPFYAVWRWANMEDCWRKCLFAIVCTTFIGNLKTPPDPSLGPLCKIAYFLSAYSPKIRKA